MTLRSRLAILLGVLVAVAAVSGGIVVVTQRQFLIDQVDVQLRSAAVPISQFPPGLIGGGPPFGRQQSAPRLISDLWIAEIGSDGSVGSSTSQLNGSTAPRLDAAAVRALRSGRPATVPARRGDGEVRVMLVDRAAGSGAIAVGISLDSVDNSTRRLLYAVAVGVGIMALVSLLLGWWVWRLGLRPIRRMTATADAITAGAPDQRIDPPTPGTEAAQLARALNAMLDQRQRTEERLRQFVGDASHELRTPLTSIRGYADLYRRGGLEGQGAVADAMGRIRAESTRMGQLVDELLLLAQLDQDRPLRNGRVNIGRLIADAADDATAAAPGREVTASASAPLLVDGDEDRLRQVLAALVTNALVHTDGPVRIRAAAASRGSVAIEVIDHGPGMSREVADHVFERFYRGESARQHGRRGSGLGLAIVASIVAAHSGTIELHTSPTGGTVVTVVLPSTPGRAGSNGRTGESQATARHP